jgi:replicative superfamily II helicase
MYKNYKILCVFFISICLFGCSGCKLLENAVSDVDGWDVVQAGGRAGRMGYAPKGDVWWYISKKESAEILNNMPPIVSALRDPDNLAFQILGEMPMYDEVSVDELVNWYQKTLLYKQNPEEVSKGIFNKAATILINRTGCLFYDQKERILKLTTKGKIAKRFYLHPWEIHRLSLTLEKLRDLKNEIPDFSFQNPALALLALLAHGGARQKIYISEKEWVFVRYSDDEWMNFMFDYDLFQNDIHAFLVHHILQWYKKRVRGDFQADLHFKVRSYMYDLSRIGNVCACLAEEKLKWNDATILQDMSSIIRLGAPVSALDLLRIRGVGDKRMQQLLSFGIRDKDTLYARYKSDSRISAILPTSVLAEIEQACC